VQIVNPELLRQALAGKGSTVKFILNDSAIVFLPVKHQHRDVKSHGLSYEDEYRGNALAGLVTPTGVEVRYHQAYSEERIRAIWTKLRALPDFADARLSRVLYQGKEI